MARTFNRLTAPFVAGLLKRASEGKLRKEDYGLHADGGNLYLSVTENGGISWIFKYRWLRKQPELGFGSAREVSLGSAREKAAAARAQLAAGINPKSTFKAKLTLEAAAREVIDSMAPAWRSEKHRRQWYTTLLGESPPDQNGRIKRCSVDYCAAIRPLLVGQLTLEDALQVLKPIWQTRLVTAQRLRGRLERIWDYARTRGHCDGRNPFAWRGNLSTLLPKRQKIAIKHFPAMSYADVPDFMTTLRSRAARSARALEFCILTATRSGETLGATWSEFDLDSGLWSIPAGRMKSGVKHEIPLSSRALAIVKQMQGVRRSDFVFPGYRPNAPITSKALEMLLWRMNVTDVTVHGFRSSFRDWAGDSTSFQRDVVEAALAHQITNQVEAAYRRSTALAKRRKLMEAWAGYCSKPATANKVVLFHSQAAAGAS